MKLFCISTCLYQRLIVAVTIQSLERGLEILNILSRSSGPMSLNEISGNFTIDRSSVFRLVTTLVRAGYVRQDDTTKRYSLGYRVLELAGSFNEHVHIENIIRPVMRRVLEKTMQNTHLAVLDGIDMVFIAVEQPKSSITMSASIGTREPAWVTALGRAFLAFLPSDEQEQVIISSKVKKYTPNTISSVRDLRKNLEHVRETRLAMDNEEYKPGVVCFAAPVLDHRKRSIFSVGISGPVNLILPHTEEIGNIIKNAGIEISALLGCTPD